MNRYYVCGKVRTTVRSASSQVVMSSWRYRLGRSEGGGMARRRWLMAGAGLLGALLWTLRDVPVALGARTTPTERVRRSPQYRDGVFHNAANTTTMSPAGLRETLRDLVFGKQQRAPLGTVPLARSADSTTAGLHVTWYGHSSALVELDGARVLF